MPTIVGVTPNEKPKPVVQFWARQDRKTKRNLLNLPTGATPDITAIEAYLAAKGEITNLGLWKYSANGTTKSILFGTAEVWDELYDENVCLVATFQDTNTQEIVRDYIYAPDAGALSGYDLDVVNNTRASTYIANTVLMLNAGGGAFTYVSGRIKNTGAASQQAIAIDPDGDAGLPEPEPI